MELGILRASEQIISHFAEGIVLVLTIQGLRPIKISILYLTSQRKFYFQKQSKRVFKNYFLKHS